MKFLFTFFVLLPPLFFFEPNICLFLHILEPFLLTSFPPFLFLFSFPDQAISLMSNVTFFLIMEVSWGAASVTQRFLINVDGKCCRNAKRCCWNTEVLLQKSLNSVVHPTWFSSAGICHVSCFMVPGWFFMVPGWFSWSFMVPSGFSWFSCFQVGFSWFQVGFHGFSWFQVGFHDFSWFQVCFSWFFIFSLKILGKSWKIWIELKNSNWKQLGKSWKKIRKKVERDWKKSWEKKLKKM